MYYVYNYPILFVLFLVKAKVLCHLWLTSVRVITFQPSRLLAVISILRVRSFVVDVKVKPHLKLDGFGISFEPVRKVTRRITLIARPNWSNTNYTVSMCTAQFIIEICLISMILCYFAVSINKSRLKSKE